MATIVKVPGKTGVRYKAVIRHRDLPGKITRTFSTKTLAREWARKTESDQEKMRALGSPELRRHTVAEAIHEHILRFTGKDVSIAGRLDFWRDHLGHVKLIDLTQNDIKAELARLADTPARQTRRGHQAIPTDRKLSPATINRYLSALSATLRTAQDLGWLDKNPCEGIRQKKEKNRFGRAIKADELERLLEACKESQWDRLHLLVTMAYTCGARLGELFSLTWGDIDLKHGLAKLAETKNGNPRILILIPEVVSQIKALPRPIDPLTCLFPSEADPHESFYKSFRPHWNATLKRADVENLRFHDLRHSAATAMIQAGIPSITVAQVLGHRQLSMTLRYSHADTASTSKAVNNTFAGVLK